MEFFDPPEPPPAPLRRARRRPDWFGPPENIAPGVVPLELVLANTGDVAIYLNAVFAYPTGFELTLEVRARDPDENLEPTPWEWRAGKRWGRGRDSGELPPDLLRFGVQFADGSKVTNVRSRSAFSDEDKEHSASASGPSMVDHAGRGDNAT